MEEGKDSKRHWAVLRDAIRRDRKRVNESAAKTISELATQFFQMFEIIESDMSSQPCSEWIRKRYDISMHGYGNLQIYIREKCASRSFVRLEDLVCHRFNKGIDNTGNIKTWPSEQVLLFFLLRNRICQAQLELKRLGGSDFLEGIRVCELGCGMSGLISLGLLAHRPVLFESLWITDGNEQCVENVAQNFAYNDSISGSNTDVQIRKLLWNDSDSLDALERPLFDLIVLSDCLFFEKFHVDLARLIAEILAPFGRCYSMQPHRSGSLKRFVGIAEKSGLVVAEMEHYDTVVSMMHEDYVVSNSSVYQPDVHYPVLLCITRQNESSSVL